jgi:hypothetical protein
MSLPQAALDAPSCVISVMGVHTGEGVEAIFRRKVADCKATSRTFWVAKSAKARPEQVQALCASGCGYVIFVTPATLGGARPTTAAERATEYSADRISWLPLPQGIGPVTGQMDDTATALVFDQLTTDVHGALDIWRYADARVPDLPVKFMLGTSTVCAVQKDMSHHPQRMKSRHRQIVAVARLVEPHCVWVR